MTILQDERTPSPPVAGVLSGGRGSAVVRGSETAARRLEGVSRSRRGGWEAAVEACPWSRKARLSQE